MRIFIVALIAACFVSSCGPSLYYGYLPGTDYKMLKPMTSIDLKEKSFNIEFKDSRGNRNVIDCSDYILDRETELEGATGAQYFRDSITAMIQESNGKIDPTSPNKIVIELEGLSFNLIGRGYATVHGFVQFKVTSSFLNKTYCSDMTDLDKDSPLPSNSWVTRKTASRTMVSGSMRRAAENFAHELAGGKAPMVSTRAIRTRYKTNDLNQDFVKEFKINSNYFYKFDSCYSVDYAVAIVRMNVFASPATENMGEILLSLGLVGKEKSFDCNAFYSKLSADEKNLVDSRMESHPYICRNPGYTSETALASFAGTLSPKIDNYRSADAHWAWFGATGDTEPLKRLLDNYLYNSSTCVDCIKWSYPSNTRQNPDVRNYLLNYMADKTDLEKQKLSTLVPKNTNDSDPYSPFPH